ncbi:MAG: hypothetical protein ACLQVY_29665 [Limisphaerales bacterium]
MKTRRGLIVVAAALALCGCGKQQNAPPPAAAAAPASGSASSSGTSGNYLGALAHGEQRAVKTIDVTSLNENLQLFNAQEGRYPKDLNELVTQHYLGKLPAPPVGMKFVYDADQGKVSVAPQ